MISRGWILACARMTLKREVVGGGWGGWSRGQAEPWGWQPGERHRHHRPILFLRHPRAGEEHLGEITLSLRPRLDAARRLHPEGVTRSGGGEGGLELRAGPRPTQRGV